MEAYLGIIGKVFMTIIFRKNRRTEVFSSAACVHSICFNGKKTGAGRICFLEANLEDNHPAETQATYLKLKQNPPTSQPF